jgi:hypothetical protein
MQMLFVIVTVVMISGEARFILTGQGFETLAECKSELSTEESPDAVCAEVPEFYLNRRAGQTKSFGL